MKRSLAGLGLAAMLVFGLVGCSGDDGAQGPAGASGPTGPTAPPPTTAERTRMGGSATGQAKMTQMRV